MDLRSKTRRLCEKLKTTKKSDNKKSVISKGKSSNSKIKPKKHCKNTFSMIKFYESIPSNIKHYLNKINKIKIKNKSILDYEDIRHLPDCDFSERLSLLKKIHCDLSQPIVHRVHSGTSKTSGSCRRKTSAKKKQDSPPKRNTISPSLCRVCVKILKT